jgi:hypothetical protein
MKAFPEHDSETTAMQVISAAILLLALAGPAGSSEPSSPETFRILVAPIPAPATPGLFPPSEEEVLEAWQSRRLDRAVRIEWHDLQSTPWTRVAQQVAHRRPAAVIGDYTFLLATIGTNFSPYMSWSSPAPGQVASLITLKTSGIRRTADLRDKIVGVIHVAYPLGGGAQVRLLESSGLEPEVAALGTAREVVHHLFAGTIDAAGLPHGEAEEALRHFGYSDLASEIRVIREFRCPTRYALFVRRDFLQSPIPAFPVMLAGVLADLYPPGWTLLETKKEPERGGTQ